VSHHPKDIQERYCGRCRQFHDLMADEAELLTRRMTRELETHRSMEIVVDAGGVLELAALVQLALRHPGVSAGTRRTAELFLSGVRAYFADCPAVLSVMRLGDDPSEDVSAPRC
jgi:hypothetical protein